MDKLPGPGRPALHLVSGSVAHPAEQMLQAMLQGWRSQQLSRGLNVTTIDSGESVVRRFHAHNNEWPWLWTPQMLDDWVSDLRMRRSSWSTVRGYQGAVRRFCWFITDPSTPGRWTANGSSARTRCRSARTTT